MTRRSVPHRRRFAASESGIATLEFAILLPILMIMVYGVAEYVNASDHRNKVSALARTLADLTAQNASGQVLKKEMELNLASAGPILAPFDPLPARIQISAIGVTASNATYVCSTWPVKGGLRSGGTKAASLDVPKNFQRAGARYILVDVRMDYQPLFASILRGLMKPIPLDFKWAESVAWPVRGGKSLGSGLDAEIVMPDGNACDPKAT